MPKMGKIVLAILVPLLVIVGGLYGLAKVGIIPVGPLAEKNKALIPVLKMTGLYHPEPARKTKVVPAHDTVPAPDPLAPQRAELEQERADLQAQRDAAQRAAAAAQAAQPDPRNFARLATVYEQMPPESVTRIFAKLPADHVIGILRRMDEKKVGDILALLPPDRAAQVTEALSRPAPPDSTTTNTP
jgi:hypothetical protein